MNTFAYFASTQEWLVIGLIGIVPFAVLFVALVRFLWLRAKK